MNPDTNTAAATTAGWDQADPHGEHPGHDSDAHFVANWRMQVIVLGALLFFTALTVAFYNLEAWIEVAFEIDLPLWVNIAGAMGIAVIKGLLVAAFFMQLRYDKALNSFVMLFCLLGVGLFLTFSMIDLGSRDLIDEHKAGEIIPGGTGYGLDQAPADQNLAVKLSPHVNTHGAGLIYEARLVGNKKHPGLQEYRDNPALDEAEFWTEFYAGHATHRDLLDEHNYYETLGYAHHEHVSTANASRPRHGRTPGLFSDVAPSTGHHGPMPGTDHVAPEVTEHAE